MGIHLLVKFDSAMVALDPDDAPEQVSDSQPHCSPIRTRSKLTKRAPDRDVSHSITTRDLCIANSDTPTETFRRGFERRPPRPSRRLPNEIGAFMGAETYTASG